MNIVHNDFCVMDNVKVLVPKILMSDEILLYVTTAWKKAIPNLGYARHWSKAQAVLIELPVIENSHPDHEYTVDDIDWQYMRDRITELDAYLQATGLNDYELTEDDKKILSEKVNTKEFVMRDIFEPLSVKKAVKEMFVIIRIMSFVFLWYMLNLAIMALCIGVKRGGFTTYSNVLSIVYNGVISAGKCYTQEDETGILAESYLNLRNRAEQPASNGIRGRR